jgi:hypothetical protein
MNYLTMVFSQQGKEPIFIAEYKRFHEAKGLPLAKTEPSIF